jgi:hypothetical protein
MASSSRDVVYIERDSDQPMWEHCLAAWQGFKWDKYEIRFFLPLTEDSFHTGPRVAMVMPGAVVPPLNPHIPVIGSVESIQLLFAKKKKELPKPLNVPDELLEFAGRSIERLRLEDALLRMETDHRPQFIKPADSCKLFDGGVVATPAHVAFLFAGVDANTPVLISPEINIVSEYRIYVNRDRAIASMRHYNGDPFVRPSKLFIKKMIDSYTQAPRCYSLDVGITASGKTVVVECNDFWALGTYGMDPIAYSRMSAQRWHEMVTKVN